MRDGKYSRSITYRCSRLGGRELAVPVGEAGPRATWWRHTSTFYSAVLLCTGGILLMLTPGFEKLKMAEKDCEMQKKSVSAYF